MTELVAWYPLHKDTNDWSGNGLHPTDGESVALTAGGKIGAQCLQCSKVLTILPSSKIKKALSGKGLSIALWIKEGHAYGENNWQDIIRWDAGGYSPRIERQMAYQQNNECIDIGFTFNTTPGLTIAEDDTLSVKKGDWFHFAVVREEDTISMYVNGVMQRTVELTGDLAEPFSELHHLL